MSRFNYFLILITISFTILGFGYFFLPHSSDINKKILKVAVMDWPGFYPVLIANELGYFKDENLNVEIVIVKDNPASNLKLLNREVDIAFGAFSDFALMKAIGAPIRYIYSTDYSKMDSIVGKTKNIEDLKGKTIGIGDTNSFSNFFVSNILESHSVPEDEVRFKIIPFGELKNELKNKEISAGHTWEPELTECLNDGFFQIITSEAKLGIITDGIAIREEKLNELPNVVKFLKAFEKASYELFNQKTNHYSVINKYFPQSEVHFQKLLQNSVYPLNIKDNIQGIQQNKDWKDLQFLLSKTIDYFHQRGQIRSEVPFDVVIYRPLFLELEKDSHDN